MADCARCAGPLLPGSPSSPKGGLVPGLGGTTCPPWSKRDKHPPKRESGETGATRGRVAWSCDPLPGPPEAVGARDQDPQPPRFSSEVLGAGKELDKNAMTRNKAKPAPPCG